MMIIERPAALDALDAAAIDLAVAERDLRETFAQQIAKLETGRRRAYRRFHFLSALVAADAVAADRDASRAFQRRAAAEELDWTETDAAREEVLDAMTPLADAVHDDRLAREDDARRAEDEGAAEPTPASFRTGAPAEGRETALLFALSDFEARFETMRGRAFAELFDRHMPDTPLVDF